MQEAEDLHSWLAAQKQAALAETSPGETEDEEQVLVRRGQGRNVLCGAGGHGVMSPSRASHIEGQ